MQRFRSCNPHRQLNDEETRIYAAGMAAHRRGENRPKEHLTPRLYAIWDMGWRRIGRKLPSRSILRDGPDSAMHTSHMVRTEVATLDDALKIIDQHNRHAKAAATIKQRPANWNKELWMHQIRKRQSKGTDLVIGQSPISELEARQVQYIMQAIVLLKRSVEEMSRVAAVQRYYPAVSPTIVHDIVVKLCHLINQDVPPLETLPPMPAKPTRAVTRWCQKCGLELKNNEKKFCFGCAPAMESLKEASDRKRDQLATEDDIRAIQKLTRRIKKAIDLKAINHGDD